MSSGEPNEDGEYPYNAFEKFTLEELAAAKQWRDLVRPIVRRASGKSDQCPHTPACPNVRVCIEEIAWYLKHRDEIHARESL